MAEKLTRARAEELKNMGLTLEEIGRIYKITAQGVNWHLSQSTSTPYVSPQRSRRNRMPWTITGPQVKTNPYRQLVIHLEYLDTRGRGMSEEKLRKLRNLYNRLEDFRVVIRFDPEIPPQPGHRFGGFEYVPREAADENLILRIDDNTTIPEDERDNWRIPSKGEWPE